MNNSTSSDLYSFRLYSLHKSRQILKSSYKWYKKRGKDLSDKQLGFFEAQLQELDEAILNEDRVKADSLARQVEAFCKQNFKKSVAEYVFELALAIVFAFIIAVIIRQMWFELYEIPTGSMRPTFEEKDHLTVTKTAFGINYPLKTEHLYFDPHLVQRGGIVIWSGDGVPYLDADSTFMGIFPYTKRYIKRCLGKPGDALYFYGGKIYGMDQEGRDLIELRNDPSMAKLEHIAFINFEGQRSYVQEANQGRITQAIFHQMNQAIGRLIVQRNGETRGEIFNGKEWVKDQPSAQQSPHSTIQTYSDFWGIRNFAMGRLLTKNQVEMFTLHDLNEMEEGVLYLELRHTPNLSYPAPLLLERYGAFIKSYSTLIPLQERHLKALMDNMYTARFVIKNGRAARYQLDDTRFSANSPYFPEVADGTYEFYHGKAVQVGWGGITYSLPNNHPLYQFNPSHVQKLFNMGIEMSTQFEPHSRQQIHYPYRYSYFREGDLFLLGASIIKKDDSTLKSFIEREAKREQLSSSRTPYVAFKDYGPPLTKEGDLDREFIKTFGFKLPEKHYLVLGDNHAMSQDSRAFGPIPQANLQGAPSLILWPPGDRWGIPNQRPYPLFTLPRLVIWGIAASIILLWYAFHYWNSKKPIFKKIN